MRSLPPIHTKNTGVQCADGSFERDANGCTFPFIEFRNTLASEIKIKPSETQICASAQIVTTFDFNPPIKDSVRLLLWQPCPSPRDADICNAEIDQWEMDLEAHELHHVQQATDIVTQTNDKAKPKKFSQCADTEQEARDLLMQAAAAEAGGLVSRSEN